MRIIFRSAPPFRLIRTLDAVCVYGLLFAAIPAVRAQQTYFNVPSSDVTKERKVLVQQQVEIQEKIRSTTAFSYGLSKDWEIGLNLFNIDYETKTHRFTHNDSTSQTPYAPLVIFSVQKAIELNEILKIGLGGQGGFNPTPAGRSRAAWYSYANLAGSLAQEHYQMTLGTYWGNERYLGEGDHLGLEAGVDAGIWYKKLHLLGDWRSGKHQAGLLALGIEVFLGEHLPLAVGWQRANQDGAQALVVQLTYTPQ